MPNLRSKGVTKNSNAFICEKLLVDSCVKGEYCDSGTSDLIEPCPAQGAEVTLEVGPSLLCRIQS